MKCFYANVVGKQQNKIYPNFKEIKTREDLIEVVSHDYVGAEYEKNTRSNKNFNTSDCLMLDCDNDHSDDPSTWVDLEMVKEWFPNVTMMVHYSKSHNKPKNGKAARPKFHILFPIKEIADIETYKNLKLKVNNYFPYFDSNAVDAARFFYGTTNPNVEIIQGNFNVDDFLNWIDEGKGESFKVGEGHRNGYLSSFGAKVVKRYGYTDQAYSLILQRNESVCEPPLEEEEIKNTIWKSLKGFFDRLVLTKGYVPPEQYKNWQEDLIRNEKTHAIVNCTENLELILNNDPLLKNIVYNELATDIEIIGPVAWPVKSRFWRDADDAQLVCYVNKKYTNFSKENYNNAVTKVVDDRSYHPIRNYFEKLPKWDRVPRVETFLVDYFGAEDTPYTRAVIRKILVAAYKRVFNPGIKFDYILVLNGPQGVGKSTAIAKLGMDWYSDSLNISDMNDKTAAEKLQGYWILEIGELAGMKKADIDKVKAFISRQDDKYRASFGRRVNSHPRQCIFFATTNAEDGFLRDITGNRRFWPVRTPGTGSKKAWELTADVINQIWAEVVEIAAKGENLFLDSEELSQAAEEATNSAMEHDEREGLVREYLNTLLPEDWWKMDIGARISFLSDINHEMHKEGTAQRTEVSNIEIWTECLGKRKEDFSASDSYAISAIMKSIEGWTRTSERKVVPGYGRQRVYKLQSKSSSKGQVDNLDKI